MELDGLIGLNVLKMLTFSRWLQRVLGLPPGSPAVTGAGQVVQPGTSDNVTLVRSAGRGRGGSRKVTSP